MTREGEMEITCEDCRLPYDEFGIDTTLPNSQWLAIHPKGYEGLLCANCMVKRASHITGIIAARMVLEVHLNQGKVKGYEHKEAEGGFMKYSDWLDSAKRR